jgi:hypothetical protein
VRQYLESNEMHSSFDRLSANWNLVRTE